MNTPRSVRRGSLAPLLIGCAAAALLIDLGPAQWLQTSDSIVPILASLYRWTPFYWGADRFGVPVALVAMPFSDPLTNLLVQSWINLFAALAVIPLLARCALRPADATSAAGIAAVLYLALAPAEYQFTIAAASPYPVSIALTAGGLILVAGDRPGWKRWAGAGTLVVLAHWVNVSSFVYFLPFVTLRALVAQRPPRWRATAARLGMLLAGAGAGLLFKHLADSPTTPLARQPMSQWPADWAALAGNTWQRLHHLGLAAALTAALGIGLARARRRRARLPWRETSALVGAAAVVFLFVGTMTWVRANAYSVRYAHPALLFALVGLAALAAAPLRAVLLQRERRLDTVLAVALPLVALVTFGMPSAPELRRAVEGDRDRTAEMLAAGATHMAGNYWKVWISVYRANLALYERGEHRIIWGLTNRSRATEPLWSKVPRETTRIVALRGDAEADRWVEAYGYADLRRIGESKTLVIYGVGD